MHVVVAILTLYAESVPEEVVLQLGAYIQAAQPNARIFRQEQDIVVVFVSREDYPPNMWLDHLLNHSPYERYIEQGSLPSQVWPIE